MTWSWLPPVAEPADPLVLDELGRERVRILLDRYGVLFRELTQRELPMLRWSVLFRSLRLLELAGEVLAGHFFEGIPGIQFMAPQAFSSLERHGLDGDRVWWLNATDPASVCGLGLAALSAPRRVASTHLVYHGDALVVVSTRSGKELTIDAEPDHPRLDDYLEFLRVQLSRAVEPRRAITIETINGTPAETSPFRQALAGRFHVNRCGSGLRLSRTY